MRLDRNIPKISIITPSFNQGAFISEAIQSVIDQKYPNYEHIIVDGGSTDGTVEIVGRYPNLIFISEKDDGMSDAINKGIKLATGDYIGWINTDDYYNKNAFSKIVDLFSQHKVNWIVGNIIYKNEMTGKYRQNSYFPAINYNSLLKNADIVKQPGTFYRANTLKSIGGVNKEYQMVMDYDLFIRLAKIGPPLMLNHPISVFRNHPDQKTGLNNAQQNMSIQLKEIYSILKREGLNSWERIFVLRKKIYTLAKIRIKNKFTK